MPSPANADMTLVLEVDDPTQLELFPLLLVYNHITIQEANAEAAGDVIRACTLHVLSQDLRWELEKRALVKTFAYLKRLEAEWILPPPKEKHDDRNLN